jgi:hypothetical protein
MPETPTSDRSLSPRFFAWMVLAGGACLPFWGGVCSFFVEWTAMNRGDRSGHSLLYVSWGSVSAVAFLAGALQLLRLDVDAFLAGGANARRLAGAIGLILLAAAAGISAGCLATLWATERLMATSALLTMALPLAVAAEVVSSIARGGRP